MDERDQRRSSSAGDSAESPRIGASLQLGILPLEQIVQIGPQVIVGHVHNSHTNSVGHMHLL